MFYSQSPDMVLLAIQSLNAVAPVSASHINFPSDEEDDDHLEVFLDGKFQAGRAFRDAMRHNVPFSILRS